MSIPKELDKLLPKQKRSGPQLIRLILSVQGIINQARKKGKGKLKSKASQIKDENPFFDYPVVYLPARGFAIIIGDTHGDSISILKILEQEDFVRRVKSKQDLFLVFLGDYADRGKADIRTLELILSLKKQFPQNVFMIRGNHEEVEIGQYYGLMGSCVKRFGYENGQEIFQRFNCLFENLPGLVVAANGLVAVHGGIPISEVRSLNNLDDDEDLTEIRWNDPTDETDNFIFNYKRGGYYLFGKKVFNNFLKNIGGQVLVRSHEYVARGFKFLFDNRLLSIFSNGGTSSESGYRDFILYPKYVKVDLSKPLKKWSTKHVLDIDYK